RRLRTGVATNPRGAVGQPHRAVQFCSACWHKALIMLNVDGAIARVLAAAQPLPGIEIANPCFSLNRVLAEDIRAPLAVPPADNSAMDGYAYRHADAVKASFVLPVTQRIAAGHVAAPLEQGTAARIFTGAEIPAGADTVAIQEDCTVADGSVAIAKTEPGA